MSYRALVIPVDEPVHEIELDETGNLTKWQAIVGGLVQPVGVPPFVPEADNATLYVNEEGKFDSSLRVNHRATWFAAPGANLMPGDSVVGNVIVAGFDPENGVTAELPAPVRRRVELIDELWQGAWEYVTAMAEFMASIREVR